MDEVLVHLGRRPDKAGVRQPLVEPRGGDDESKPPSAALMITTAVAAVVTGNTGFALVRCVMNAWALPEDSLLTSNTNRSDASNASTFSASMSAAPCCSTNPNDARSATP